MCTRKPVFHGETWTVEQLEHFWNKIDAIGKSWGITYPRQQIELISSDQMIETICTVGAPISYDHWSIGKDAAAMAEQYKKGKTGLALELVINSDPSIMYIMENNTLMQQGLVMAHAGIGHGSVYKNNYLFKQWTQPEAILDYMAYAKEYINQCERKYGPEEVERTLDCCHMLQNYGVSHKKQFSRHTRKKNKDMLENALEDSMQLGSTVPNFHYKEKIQAQLSAMSEGDEFPEENILYFLEKNAKIKTWQREIIRITRKMAEYFYPQTKTKILHEGWATFIELMVFEELYKNGDIDEGGYLEFLRDHSSVIWQPEHDSKYFSGQLNPYSIGFAIFKDLYRMTVDPTPEDLREYPDICNTRWQDSLMNIVKNYCDTDFLGGFLTPNVAKELGLFAINTDIVKEEVVISGTVRDLDVIRDTLVEETITFNRIPRLEIDRVNKKTGALYLYAYCAKDKRIDKPSLTNIQLHIRHFWGAPVFCTEVCYGESTEIEEN